MTLAVEQVTDGRKRFGVMWKMGAVALKASLVILLIFFAITAHAQVDAGSIRGHVTDPAGAVVPSAVVTIINEETGTKQSVKTDATGNYSFSPVRIGTYTISAEMPGFERQVQEHIRVDIQQQLSIPLTLKTGSVEQSVVVTSESTLMQSDNASVGQVIGERQINDLPLNGRNYFFLAQLSAGVTFGQKDTRGENNNGRFSANGVRSTQNDYLLDGIDNNSSIISAQNGKDFVIQTPVDALSEFKVQTNNYNAEFGRAAGAVLNATVKSGTNTFHGDVWEFLRNDALDANDYFSNYNGQPRAEFRRNQFGAALGGAVVIPHLYNGHDRTFFFGDYEGTRISQGNPITGTVPTNLERTSGYTNFSDLIQSTNNPADALGNIYHLGTIMDPATTTPHGSSYVRSPISGGTNTIPSNRLDQNAVALLSRWAIEWQQHNRKFDYLDEFLSYYGGIRRLSHSVDVVSDTTDLSRYKLVIAPALNVLTPDAAKNLEAYVRGGGHLILGRRSGMKDGNNSLWTQRQPGPLSELLGARVEQFYALTGPVPVSGEWGKGEDNIWADQLRIVSPDTQILMRYGKSNGWLDGQPAAVVRHVGAGSITYIGINLNSSVLEAASHWMLKEANLAPDFPEQSKDIDVAIRSGNGKRIYILTNYSEDQQTIKLPAAMEDILNGGKVSEVTLPQYGVAILEK